MHPFIALRQAKANSLWKDALEKYFEATGDNDKETIMLGRHISAQRIVIGSIHLPNKYELSKWDGKIVEITDGMTRQNQMLC